ncbi:IS66 family transposase [Sphingomonas sp. 35-24ZXX]|uniref:IS66 family transposase n=1 Tax=Sphingomonas sp. 35-24ZXX TaxID=1545915 RepID=UPI001E3368E4|nr:transposase [Sphingomonas sp. 35-24ZXX]
MLSKRQEQITLAFCWSHVRRKFFDLADKWPVTTEVLQRFADIYAIESEVRGTKPIPLLR